MIWLISLFDVSLIKIDTHNLKNNFVLYLTFVSLMLNYQMCQEIVGNTITGVVFISANNKIYGKNKHDKIATNEKFSIRS